LALSAATSTANRCCRLASACLNSSFFFPSSCVRHPIQVPAELPFKCVTGLSYTASCIFFLWAFDYSQGTQSGGEKPRRLFRRGLENNRNSFPERVSWTDSSTRACLVVLGGELLQLLLLQLACVLRRTQHLRFLLVVLGRELLCGGGVLLLPTTQVCVSCLMEQLHSPYALTRTRWQAAPRCGVLGPSSLRARICLFSVSSSFSSTVTRSWGGNNPNLQSVSRTASPCRPHTTLVQHPRSRSAPPEPYPV
jgi:hypothetical protein